MPNQEAHPQRGNERSCVRPVIRFVQQTGPSHAKPWLASHFSCYLGLLTSPAPTRSSISVGRADVTALIRITSCNQNFNKEARSWPEKRQQCLVFTKT
jgi:hypothetical protein